MENFFYICLYLLGISIIFILLEANFRSIKSSIFRKEWLIDVCFYFGQALIWNSFTVYILGIFFDQIDFEWLKNFQIFVKEQAFWLQIIEVILLSDFLIYWGHRIQHRYDFLWRFHRVHHTAETVDYIAAFREHPIDNIYTRGLETLPAILLGFDLNLIAGYLTFRGLWALFIHSNVSIRLGFIEILLGSPHLHHWHHELEMRGKCNYANLSPLMDILFGTYYSPRNASMQFGIEDNIDRSYIGQLLEPLFPKKAWQFLTKKIRQPLP
jgi:sterol desaturase/sphingolipid hydroxylase (fatty acid hydroxylase superfamily)